MNKSKRIARSHSRQAIFDQLLRVAPNLAIKGGIAGRSPCLGDGGLFPAKAGELSCNAKGANPIASRPQRFELAEFFFHGYLWWANQSLEVPLRMPQGVAFPKIGTS